MNNKPWHGTIAKLNTPGQEIQLDLPLVEGDPIPSRDLPLFVTAPSGDENIVVGIIESLVRDGNNVIGTGLINAKLFDLFVDRPENTEAIPIAPTVEPSATECGWRLIGAHLGDSIWGDTTIKVISME